MAHPLSALHGALVAAVIAAAAPGAAWCAGAMAGMDMSGHARELPAAAMSDMTMHDSHMGHDRMENMALHMTWSHPRPANAADEARAAAIAATLRRVLARYKNYRTAEADGYKPFHPEFKKQAVVHFTNWWYAVKAQFKFNPRQPTSLLYRRTPEGGYELIGAMYTAPRRWSEERLDARVPLSVARWHQHINLCFPPRGAAVGAVDWSKFGPNGSIASKAECDAAGGRFFPVLFGWMVHVYPWESDPKEVWAH